MRSLLVALVLAAVPSAAAAQISAEQRVLREVVRVTPEGERVVSEVPADLVAPGDRVVYRLSYRNEGPAPATGLVLVMPVPEGVVLDPASPEGPGAVAYSVDGTTFGPLAALSVATTDGPRPAAPADVRGVRWTLTAPLAPGASGEVAYKGALR